ncbi:MAG: YraN family protein [Candidatus Nomurabacteria bacterium]|nr:YraN family protein [Candidatus Nomurabacteria bacterium]
MPKVFTSETQKIGEIGENVACKFLVKQGFTIIERNYTRKYGEIDIVAQRQEKQLDKRTGDVSQVTKIYFIEVKAVTRDLSVNRETLDTWRPEDNMHPWKLKRLSRTIQTYLVAKKIPEDVEWQFDLLVVFLDMKAKKARVKIVSDVIL